LRSQAFNRIFVGFFTFDKRFALNFATDAGEKMVDAKRELTTTKVEGGIS
jgi:hypothetical protein